jgi:hypothetical protein
MADISQYSIITYERRPGHWRAAITPIGRPGSYVMGRTILSFVTPDDSDTEPEAKLAAQKLIRNL